MEHILPKDTSEPWLNPELWEGTFVPEADGSSSAELSDYSIGRMPYPGASALGGILLLVIAVCAFFTYMTVTSTQVSPQHIIAVASVLGGYAVLSFHGSKRSTPSRSVNLGAHYAAFAKLNGYNYGSGGQGTLPNKMASALVDVMSPFRGVQTRTDDALSPASALVAEGVTNTCFTVWGILGNSGYRFCAAYMQGLGFLLYVKLDRPTLNRLEIVSRKWSGQLRMVYEYKPEGNLEYSEFNKRFRVMTDIQTVEGSEMHQVVEPVTMDKLVQLSDRFGGTMRALFEEDEFLIWFMPDKKSPIYESLTKPVDNGEFSQLMAASLSDLESMATAW
ncbi:MAG: hypothetical protein K0S20_246 [Patescibacteria group bacterium]|nr:hypothetical protein [Patescibacteria group bacterium]